MEEFTAKFTDMIEKELEGKSYDEVVKCLDSLIDDLCIIKKTAEDLSR